MGRAIVRKPQAFLLDEPLSNLDAKLAGYAGRQVVLGIRPGQMKDAALTTAAPADMRLRAVVDLREELGEDSLLHYRVAARAVLSEDVEEAIADEAVDAAPVGDDLAARFVARVDAPLSCRHGRHNRVLSRHEGAPLLRPRDSPRDRRRQSGFPQPGLALALKRCRMTRCFAGRPALSTGHAPFRPRTSPAATTALLARSA
jgi:hypothetical protein